MNHFILRKHERFSCVAINFINHELIGRTNSFFRPIVSIIKDYYDAYDEFPSPNEVMVKLSSDTEEVCFLKTLDEIKKISKNELFNFEELLSNLEVYIKQRHIQKIFEKQIELKSSSGFYDAGEIEQDLDQVFGISLKEDTGFFYLEQIEKHIAELQRLDNFISSGFPSLDKALGGGFCSNDIAFYVFGGTVNVGKSLMMANLAVNCLRQNKKIQVGTFELSEKNWSKRVSSIISGIELINLHVKSDDLRLQIADLKRSLEKGCLNIKQFPANEVTPRQYSAFLKQLKRVDGFSPDIIILDMHSLMIPNAGGGGKGYNMYKDQKDLAANVRGLSYIWECPVLSPTQLDIKNASKQEDPDMSATLESQGIPQTADAQINFWQDDAAKEGSWINYRVVKSRFSQKGQSGSLTVDYTNMRMGDLKHEMEQAMTGQHPQNNIFSNDFDFDFAS